MNSNRIKYSVNNVYINTFYQMPKFLVENKEFEGLSYGAKFLYMLLKDRHKLSLSNSWYDEDGFIYLIYTREDMMNMMNVSKNTTTKFMDELKKYELIEEKKMGRGMPNKIYLLAINTENYIKNKTPKICDSRSTKNGTLDSQNLNPNNTNINNINSLSLSEDKKSYGKFKKVQLSQQEYDDLVQQVGQVLTESYIDDLDTYKESSGNTYESDYATLLRWIKRDKDKKSKINKSKTTKQQNKFHNFTQHEDKPDNLDELADKKREELYNKLKNKEK